jgi:dienelactone hydrolase
MSDRLIDRWVSGTASAEDRAELAELIEKDPTLIDRLFRAAERECDLHEFFGGLKPISVRPQVSTARIVRQPRTPSQTWWLPISSGVAAALLVAITAFHLISGRQSDPTPTTANTPATPAAVTAPVVARPITPPVSSSTTPVEEDHTTLAQVFAETVPDTTPSIAQPAPRPAPTKVTSTDKPTGPMLAASTAKPTNREPHFDRLDGELKNADGSLIMRYSLRAPHVLPMRAELGLVLCFHGAGGNEQGMSDPTLKALETHGEVNMVIASLKSKGESWAAGDEGNVLSFIEWATRTYPIDRRRIVIQGVSNGGWMVSYFGSRHPELVAGVVTVCGGNGFEAPVKRPNNAAETGLEYYVVHGTADEDVNVKHARGITAALRSNGFRYVYREYPGVGHDVYSDEATRRDFAGWMTRLRHKTMPLAEEDRKALAPFTNRDEAERLLLTDDGVRTLVRIGGLPAEKVLVRALRSKNPQVRATAAGLFSQTATMPGAATLLAGLLNDKDAAVREAVIVSLARAADWNDQDALIALCRFAGGKNNKTGERLDVVRALTGAIAYRCTPGHDNQLIHELLVHLLDDDDISLRAAAIEALPTVTPMQFGYDPAGTANERRDGVAQWRRWYREKFAPPDEKTDQPR